MLTDAALSIVFETGRFLLSLKQKGTIQGKVKGRDGEPASNAKLKLFSITKGQHTWSCTTALSGSFVFDNIPPGAYRIDIECGAYRFADMDRLYLPAGKSVFVEISVPVNGVDRAAFPRSDRIPEESVGLDISLKDGLAKLTEINGRLFFCPHLNEEYSVIVSNRSSHAILAVITVDGLSVMDGQPGDFYSGGYILAPLSQASIPGWRLNDQEVARFIFLGKDESYASLTHRPTNIGVISCAFFQKAPEPDWSNCLFSETFEPDDLGTGFGKRVEHKVEKAEFRRADSPSVIKRIYYTASAAKVADGKFLPNPFPGCNPPVGWKEK